MLDGALAAQMPSPLAFFRATIAAVSNDGDFLLKLIMSLMLSFLCLLNEQALAAPDMSQDNSPIKEILRGSTPIHWTGQFKFERAVELQKEVGLPIYRWLPVGQKPRAVVLAIHGLTLHAQCYEVLARAFAAAGFLFIAPDMRGYGECTRPDAPADIQKINNQKSFEDIVKLSRLLNKEYDGLPMAVLGESLGTSFAIKLAAEQPDLVDAIIIAAPTSKVNPLMYLAPQTIFEGIKALFTPGHKMSYKVFFDKLVSNNPAIIKELEEDPLILKSVTLKSLLQTQSFVSKTDKWAKSVRKDTPVLILQGGQDQAMVPKDVTALTKNINSTDQTIRWISGYGHLLLETDYIGPPAMDAITSFIDDHEAEEQAIRAELYAEMTRFGAKDLPLMK